MKIEAAARLQATQVTAGHSEESLELEAAKIVSWLTSATRGSVTLRPRAGGGKYTHVSVPGLLQIDVNVEDGKIDVNGEYLPAMELWRVRGVKAAQIISALKRQIKHTLDKLSETPSRYVDILHTMLK